ncbi:MAG: hypothetical protein A2W19_13020 [Spirochaetes bacterium RBG_16_49_21]|nr:MAG: hypothetical protein A2W19_13020 [Spirochaetes bacterium RBG_16_49_21]
MIIMKHILIFLLFLLSCGSTAERGFPSDSTPGQWLRDVAVDYEVDGKKQRAAIQIYFPRGYAHGAPARTLILLHGWKQNPCDWEKNTPIAEYADAFGFVLVCPAMSSTLYESRYFPETTNRWAAMPGGRYIAEMLIDFLRKKFGLTAERELTGIFGISTGGRGALLLASRNSGIFGAAAGLSGDYDSLSIKNDRLLVSVYGPYDSHADRWEDEVNIIKLAKNLKNTPVFLGHGTRDAVVPPAQTKMLADRLKELHDREGGYDLVYDREKSNNAGHDWKYWAGLVPDVMKFFDRKLKK